jgi:transposase
VPRPVQIRASYRDDAAYLLRLEEALSKDDRQTAAWRKEACELARSLSVKLLQAKTPEQKNGSKKADRAAP